MNYYSSESIEIYNLYNCKGKGIKNGGKRVSKKKGIDNTGRDADKVARVRESSHGRRSVSSIFAV